MRRVESYRKREHVHAELGVYIRAMHPAERALCTSLFLCHLNHTLISVAGGWTSQAQLRQHVD